MENNINYKEEIQKLLQWIPEEYLASLYQVISLMAKPFQKEEESTLNPTIVKEYIEEFRMGFGFYFDENSKLNAKYHIGENLTYACFSVVEVALFEQKVSCVATSMEKLLEEKEVSLKVFEQKLQENQKVTLYEDNSFYIVKASKAEYWNNEQAGEDTKAEIAKVLAKLPNYSTNEI